MKHSPNKDAQILEFSREKKFTIAPKITRIPEGISPTQGIGKVVFLGGFMQDISAAVHEATTRPGMELISH